jgi:hypothetical protein
MGDETICLIVNSSSISTIVSLTGNLYTPCELAVEAVSEPGQEVLWKCFVGLPTLALGLWPTAKALQVVA